MGTTMHGLTSEEAARRLAAVGPNAVRNHRAQWGVVLVRQLRSPLLVLLVAAAVASFFLGERTDAIIIAVILTASVGLGFVNEYRAAVAAEALHSRIRHVVTVVRDGGPARVDVAAVVPGDVIHLQLGEVVPADLRLLSAVDLECDESVITGESLPVAKDSDATRSADEEVPGRGDGTTVAWMGTVVSAGTGTGVVVATGASTQFGQIAVALGTRHQETEFQVGLRKFSGMLVVVAGVLTTFVLVANLALHRPFIDAVLFSLAIAVGITPQLLPAIVSASLAAGSSALASRKVLVKRLVCIEDLGDIQILMTDKTGTLTQGRISFMRAVPARPTGTRSGDVVRLGMLCNSTPPDEGSDSGGARGRGGRPAAYGGGDPLDVALWESPRAADHLEAVRATTRVSTLPFDHVRRRVSVVVEEADGGRWLVTKGAPEQVLAACVDVPAGAEDALRREFEAGGRVVAVARRPWLSSVDPTPDDESGLELVGYLVFLDAPKATARAALRRLDDLGVDVKVITGDNPLVAHAVGSELGLPERRVLTGDEIEGLDDVGLAAAVAESGMFARVSPEQKARIVRAQRSHGLDVAFLGDGVNDAPAIHAADIGISVDTATDVAKDAADIVLLEKDLGVLAEGVVEGRRIFANTIKYVLMGTSSNFGNMFSAAGASAVLPFLPMLPSQVLLNNLLYDASQLAIPGDTVDPEQLHRPSHWDLRLIRRYMFFFGPLSSIFDFGTFALMLWGFHASESLFQTAWFVESLATQSLVVFVIRTRRTPFFRSRPSVGLLASVVGCVLLGALLPFTPLSTGLGFVPLPGGVLATIVGLVITYLVLAELAKGRFFRRVAAAPAPPPTPAVTRPRPPGAGPVVPHPRRVHRRASRFSAREPAPQRARRRAKRPTRPAP